MSSAKRIWTFGNWMFIWTRIIATYNIIRQNTVAVYVISYNQRQVNKLINVIDTMSHWQKIVRTIWALCCLLLLWAGISDYLQFTEHPELYPIGEGFGWIYESSRNYIASCWIIVCWAVVGIGVSALYRLKYNMVCFFAHIILTILSIGLLVWKWQT